MEIRRIDDLGRVVIPRKIRMRLGIEQGDMLNIKVVDGRLVISKAEG